MTKVPPEYLEAPYEELPCLNDSASNYYCLVSAATGFWLNDWGTHPASQGAVLLPPFSCAYIKGWKRGTMLLIVLQAIRELQLDDNIAHWIKAAAQRLLS